MTKGTRLVAALGFTWAACAPTSPPASGASHAEQASVDARRAEQSGESSPAVRTAEHQHSPPTLDSDQGLLRALEVPGFLPSLVYEPTGTEPRPLLVATHGAGGVPEGDCAYWRELTAGRAFLLCLRGTPLDQREPSGFYYKDHRALGREFVAAVAQFRQKYGARLAATARVYAGFSQGAIMGAPMIVPHAGDFRRLALIEGGYEYWSLGTARSFAANGGERVLFVCGTQTCKQKAEIPAAWLREAKVAVRIEFAEGAGHTPFGEVMDRTVKALPWLLEGASHWL